MSALCYVGIPQQWESPKGVMIRTAYHNGYSTVATMCAFLNVPYHRDALDLLTEQSPLFSRLTMTAPDLAQRLSANSYTVKNTDATLWILDEISLYRSQFAHYFAYCPECLRNELITVFQDVRDLPVCPLHQTLIVTHCPDCHEREHWTNANLLFCKCGSDRRNSKCLKGTMMEADRLQAFGPISDIHKLSQMTYIAHICEDIWISRKPNKEKNSFFLIDEIRNHASKMITEQLANYPGFTRSMHLSPWRTSHPLLIKLANELITEPNPANLNCETGLCCIDVELTLREINYSMAGSKKWSQKIFNSHNFEVKRYGRGVPYYHCHAPICRLIRSTLDRLLNIKSKAESLSHNYLTMREAAALLHCRITTILQLAELGYLQRAKNKKTGKGYAILISKTSIKNFNNTYILASKLSHTLKTTQRQTIRQLNQLGITKHQNKQGPHIYEQFKIPFILEELRDKIKQPAQLFPIALPPPQNIDNTLKIASTNTAPTEETTQFRPTSIERQATGFTASQVANFLKISPRLLHFRFVLTGLIKPDIIGETPCYSLAHIQIINSHLQQHLSLEQVTKTMKCSRDEVLRLINTSELQASCALAYSNGDIQLLYSQCDIHILKAHSLTKKYTEYQATNTANQNLLAPATEPVMPDSPLTWLWVMPPL
ncbi:TniQ family protein [Pseudomonas sp. PSB11]|uniref:TniQ family protein n=1 Tax=Pseudomonas sp. PSB11 TaxID=2021969 RepID=UPI0016600AA6